MLSEGHESNFNMKRLLLLAFGCLIALPAFTQTDSLRLWSSIDIPLYHAGQTVPAATKNKLVVVEVPAGQSVKIVQVVLDSTWQVTEYNNNSSAIVYSAGWVAGTGAAKFYGNDFQYGNPVQARTATFTVTLTKPGKISFDSERFNTAPNAHGLYYLSLDNVNVTPNGINAGLAPVGSDKDRGKSSYRSPLLQPGVHKIVLSTSAQAVVDRFSVAQLTLVEQ